MLLFGHAWITVGIAYACDIFTDRLSNNHESNPGWMPNIIHSLFSEPLTYIPEIIGLAVILLLGYSLLVKKGGTNFVKEGYLSV